MYEIIKEFPNEIIFEQKGACVSLYQPTHRSRPENMQDPIRFKNLIQKIENSLGKDHSEEEIKKIMKSFKDIAEDKIFWNNVSDGLAILANKEKCVVYKLNREVDEFAVVADSFHIKPLIRNFQSSDRYHVLGITREDFNLYEGNRYGIEMIKMDDDIPKTLEEVLGDQYTEPHLTSAAYGGPGGTPMFHGQGGRKEEVEIDTERYFRYIDKFIRDNFSNEERIPLMLVALDEHQGEFRNISKNNFLLEEKVNKDPEALPREEIEKFTWEKMEPLYLQKTKDLVERYGLQRSKFLGTDDLAEIARAALEGRVDTLMIESGKIEAGKINRETGELERGDLNNPELDDVLDDLGEMTLKSKGEVVVLPKDRIPSTTGVAAIFRY